MMNKFWSKVAKSTTFAHSLFPLVFLDFIPIKAIPKFHKRMSNGQYNLKMTKIRIKFTNIESQSGLSIPHCCVPL